MSDVAKEPLGKTALVTGASRGIGAEVARQLASKGFLVIVNYREKRTRAEKVVAEIKRAGGRALALGADLFDESSTTAMVSNITQRCGKLDLLILNASGGLELGAGPEYAMHLNRDSQVRLAGLVRPILQPGGRIVFVTSHQSHFFGQQPVRTVPSRLSTISQTPLWRLPPHPSHPGRRSMWEAQITWQKKSPPSFVRARSLGR